MSVKISGVTPHSPAAKAGVKAGELLVSIDGNPIGDVSQLRDHDIIVNYDPTAA